jgi:hypothetical protein
MRIGIIPVMVRRTITLPESLDQLVRREAAEGESFSAAVSRLIEAGLATDKPRPAWIGAGSSDVDDLGRNAEKYLRQLFSER